MDRSEFRVPTFIDHGEPDEDDDMPVQASASLSAMLGTASSSGVLDILDMDDTSKFRDILAATNIGKEIDKQIASGKTVTIFVPTNDAIDAMPKNAMQLFRQKQYAGARDAFVRQHVAMNNLDEKLASARMDGVPFPVVASSNEKKHIGISSGNGRQQIVELYDDTKSIEESMVASASILETKNRYTGVIVHKVDKALFD